MEVRWAHRMMASYSSALPLVEEEKELFPLRTVSSVVALFESVLKRSSQPDLALFSIICGYIENTLTCNPSLIQAASQQHQLQQLQQQQQTSISNKVSSVLSSEPSTIVSNVSEKCLTATLNANDADDFPPVELHVIEALYIKFRAIIKSSVDLDQYGSPVFATRELVKRVSDVIWNTLTRSYYKDRAHLQSVYSYLIGNKLDCFGVALAVVAACQVLSYNDVHLALSEDHAWVTFGEDGKETAEVTWHGKGNEDKRGQPVDLGIQARSWLYVEGKPVVCSRFTELAALVSSINPSVSATIDCIEVGSLQQSLLWLLYDNKHLDCYPMALGNLADLEELSPTPGRPHCSQLFDQAITVARNCYDNRHVYPYTYQGGYFYRNRLYKEALESWANAADVIRAYNYSREDEEIYKEFLEIANELIPYVMKVEGSGHSARSILKDPECFAHLLRFYDGICQWEEGSTTPVLHIGWAKPLVNTISKFDARVRGLVAISCSNEQAEDNDLSDSLAKQKTAEGRGVELKDANANELLIPWPPDAKANGRKQEEDTMPHSLASQSTTAIVGTRAGSVQEEQPRIDVAALTDLCGRTLLSPAFFLGPHCQRPALDSSEATLTVTGIQGSAQRSATAAGTGPANIENENQSSIKVKPRLYLRSHKMAGLKDLLLAEKLNTHAISLQLTAQSQVQLGGRGKLRDNAETKDTSNKTSDKDQGTRNESHSTQVPSRPKRNRKE